MSLARVIVREFWRVLRSAAALAWVGACVFVVVGWFALGLLTIASGG